MKQLDLNRRQVMSIINITPDSFYAGSRTECEDDIRERVRHAIEAGGSIMDIGGYSSRPGAADVDIEEEWRRVELGCRMVREISQDVAISIDTFRSEVARRAAEAFGEVIINDITAGEADPAIVDVVAEYKLPYVAMHMRGTPQTMQQMTSYEGDITSEVVDYFRTRCEELKQRGVERIVIDPGFGFAKSLDQNYELLGSLHRLCELGYPILVGVSRKSMIYKVIDAEPKDALAGTIAIGWESLKQGVAILRVHDTAEAVQSIEIFERYINNIK